MGENRVLSFATIAAFFKENNAQLQRGENAYQSGNVSNMIFDPSVAPALLQGKVKASMKQRSYDVKLSIDKDDGIVEASCSCPRGQTICHHMAALCVFGHHNISSTDQAAMWNAPRTCGNKNVKTVNDIYPMRKPEYCAVSRVATEEEISTFRGNLDATVGFQWLLRPESTAMRQILPEIEAIIFSAEYLAAPNKRRYLEEKCVLSLEDIRTLAELTTGQGKNENWLVARKYRLTASNFGTVLAAVERLEEGKSKNIPPSLFKQLVGGYDLSGVKQIQWGRDNEKVAVEVFSKATDKAVTPTGLWLTTDGYLGASPDGFVGDDSLVEVKCPYKFRNTKLSNELKLNKNYVIYKDKDGTTIVNESHHYWHQIQGQLHITNKKKCYLVVWTPSEVEIVIVPKVEGWKNNLEILKDFYFEHFIPYLSGQNVKDNM